MPANIGVGSLFSDKFDADKAIEKLVELEKSKSDKWENEKFLLNLRKKAWEGVQKKLNEMDAALKSFYNPISSPFRRMKVKSDNEAILEANADNKVKIGDYQFIVHKIARPDIFRSDLLERKTKLDPVKFEVLYKGKTTVCNFKGGNVDSFVNFLNERLPQILSATILKVDDKYVMIHIEGKETGEEARINFRGELKPLEQIGLLKQYTYSDFNLNLTDASGLGSNKPLSEIIKDGELHVVPGAEIDKVLETPQKGGEKIFLQFKMKIQDYQAPVDPKDAINQVKIGIIDRVFVGETDIEGENLLTNPDFGPKEKPVITDKNILTVSYRDQLDLVNFPYDELSLEWQDIKIELKDSYINRLSLKNPYNEKELIIKDMQIVDENKKGYVPKNSLDRANDAEVEYKGVKINRPNNAINDLIQGLTLTLKRPSTTPIGVNVDWNYEKIKEKVMEFIIMYNNSMDYMKHVTKVTPPKNQKQMNAWRQSFENISRDEAKEKDNTGELYTGVLNGDITLSMIKTKLRSALTNPYETRAGNEMRFAVQLGIELARYNPGSASEEDRENLKAGYLDFNDEKFDKKLKDMYEAVQEYFFRDSNGNLIYNDGLSLKMGEVLKMTASDSFRGNDGKAQQGTIKTRIAMLENRIKMRDRDIKRWENHVEEFEKRTRAQFARMYGAMQKAKSQESRLSNFNAQNK